MGELRLGENGLSSGTMKLTAGGSTANWRSSTRTRSGLSRLSFDPFFTCSLPETTGHERRVLPVLFVGDPLRLRTDWTSNMQFRFLSS
jgi:hypothetical protein